MGRVMRRAPQTAQYAAPPPSRGQAIAPYTVYLCRFTVTSVTSVPPGLMLTDCERPRVLTATPAEKPAPSTIAEIFGPLMRPERLPETPRVASDHVPVTRVPSVSTLLLISNL